MKKLFILMAVLGAFFVMAPTAMAWTPEECPTPQTHPDCEKYFPPEEPPVVVPPVEEEPVTPTPPVVEEPVLPPPVEAPKPPIEAPNPPEKKVNPPKKVEKPNGGTPYVPVQEVQTVSTETLPYTGSEDWILVLTGATLLAGGVAIRRKYAVQ